MITLEFSRLITHPHAIPPLRHQQLDKLVSGLPFDSCVTSANRIIGNSVPSRRACVETLQLYKIQGHRITQCSTKALTPLQVQLSIASRPHSRGRVLCVCVLAHVSAICIRACRGVAHRVGRRAATAGGKARQPHEIDRVWAVATRSIGGSSAWAGCRCGRAPRHRGAVRL